MKRLLAVLLVLSFAVIAALLAHHDPGFVVIGRGAWTLTTSLAIFLLLLLGVFVMLHLGSRLLGGFWRLPERWSADRRERARRQTHTALLQGFSGLAEGQWQRAEHAALKGNPGFLHYLIAAYAAQRRGNPRQSDIYLQFARQNANAEYALATALARAELYLERQQFGPALALLKPLQEQNPKHPRILQRLAEANRSAGKWPALLELMPELRRRKVFAADEIERMEQQAMLALLAEAAELGAEVLDRQWEKLPKAARLQPRLVEFYARQLQAQNRAALAESLLREALRQHWDAGLACLYAQLDGDPMKLLNQAETWLKGHEGDAVLLLALGRLCIRNRLWGKAQQYLDHSLARAPRPETYQALGELLTQMGDIAQAAEQYRKGLQLSLEPPRRGDSA
jgi:HemY protein